MTLKYIPGFPVASINRWATLRPTPQRLSATHLSLAIYMSQNNDDEPANADFTLRHDPTMNTVSSDESAMMERRLRLHRIVPLVAGVLVPFSIILNITSLTGTWLVVDGKGQDVGMETSPGHAALLVITLAFAVIVNIALVARFTSCRVTLATRVALVSAALHDVTVICILVAYSVHHRLTPNSYYGEGFWTMLASSVFCFTVTMLLTFDRINTPYKIRDGNCSTQSQRALVLEIIVLCTWLAFGALFFSLAESWKYSDGFYFAVVTLTTIGFGDLTPKTAVGRIVLFFWAVIGIIILGFAINGIRTVILEDIESTYISQVEHLRRRRKEHKRRRYEHHMLHRDDPRHHRFHLHLHHPHDHCPEHCRKCEESLNGNGQVAGDDTSPFSDHSSSLTPEQELIEDRNAAKREEAIEYRRKTTFASLAFGLFWTLGAVIFMFSEGWNYFEALYFCFVAFATIGYGDVAPLSIAGRSIFIGYVFIGVITMSYFGTILAEQIARVLKYHFSAFERQFKIGVKSSSDATLSVLEDDGLGMKGEKNEKGEIEGRTHLMKMMHAARKFDEHMRHLLRRETHSHQHNHERNGEMGGKKVKLTTTQEVEWELLIHYRQTFAELLIAAERFALEAEAEMPGLGRGDMDMDVDIDIDVVEAQRGENQDHDDDSSTKHEVSIEEPCVECELDKEVERRIRRGADGKVWMPREVNVMVDVDMEEDMEGQGGGCVECKRLKEK